MGSKGQEGSTPKVSILDNTEQELHNDTGVFLKLA